MDPVRRKRLHDDLRGILHGELLFDELSCVLYRTDASLFESEPAGIVIPRDRDDLAALIAYAGENQIPLIPRGGGSNRTGACLGSGLIVDLSVHFRDFRLASADLLEVEVGVPLRSLQQFLAARGKRLLWDEDHLEGTLGGLLAVNPAGARAEVLGTVVRQVQAVEVALDSAEIVSLRPASLWSTPAGPTGRLSDIVASSTTLLEQSRDILLASRRAVPLDHCGYQLNDVLTGSRLDLARLLIGSEGTLAIFTAASLTTQPIPAGRSVVLLAFARLESALRAATLAAEALPVACELLERRFLRLARSEPGMADLVPEGAEAVLLVEFESDNPDLARQLGEQLALRLAQKERLAIQATVARTPTDCDRLWQLRRATQLGYTTRSSAVQPVVLIDDVAVPPDRLGDYLPRLQDILRRQETTAAFVIHTLGGRVEMFPFVDLQNSRSTDRLWTLADEIYSLVLDLGGTISAARGTGLARMPWVGRQVGPLASVLREIKRTFDPRYLFNPGKIVTGPDLPVTWPLRRRSETGDLAPLRTAPPHLHWAATGPGPESLACHGCGACRSEVSQERMCPTFRATLAEAASPRAKANLMRHLLEPTTDPSLLSSDHVRAIADLCVNCKMCARECPSKVQIPRLMLEAKAANVAQHGLDRSDWVMARTESFAYLGSALAPLTNALLANPLSRWLLERFFGISRQRRLPRFSSRSFLRTARRRGWTRRPRSARPRVAYFVDIFANYNDPLIAEAVVEVLQHNGIEVYVPPDQLGCGMAPLAYGDVETARELLQHNLHILADLARDGFPILCSEPTAALMLRHDSLDLLGEDDDAQIVAAQVVEFTAFLWDLHLQGLLRTDFHRLDLAIGHHVPCHIKALGRPPVAPDLLSLIPGVRVGTIDRSCSGMAGTFGLRSDSYDTSMAAGRPMLDELSRPAYLFGSTECSACRMQMEDGTLKRTLHPAQYLALAYNLLPEIGRRLHEPIGEWVLQ